MDQLLDIAAETFIADGFGGASINVIVKRAGASKASLYSRFPTKEDLFVAVLEHRMNQIFKDVSANVAQDLPLREALLGFGMEVLHSALSDAQIALIRIISMEALRFPQLGSRFFELGPARGQAALARFFRKQICTGALRDESPMIMAQHFIGLVAGPPLLRRLLGVISPLDKGKQSRIYLERAVDAFIVAYKA